MICNGLAECRGTRLSTLRDLWPHGSSMAEGGKDKGEERDHKAYVNGVVGGSHQADGVLTHTPDSPQESETRASAGPLDFEGPGPWADDTREGAGESRQRIGG